MTKETIDTILIIYSRSINETTLTKHYLNKLRQAVPDVQIITLTDQKKWEQFKAKNDLSKVNVTFGAMNINWLKHLPNLRWVQLTSAGVDKLKMDTPETKERNIIITTSAGTHAVQIAEHIIALMLTLSRDLQRSIRRQIEHKWFRRSHWSTMGELNEKTMGLIGVGKVGQMAAKKAKALDMKVIGMRRNPTLSVPFVDKMYGTDGLMDLLSSSDWVVIAAALTAETRGLIGVNELKAMKKTACIINIARGPIIQEKVLIQALQEGWIAGAGLDVFEEEPLPADSPLWDMENVVITPHIAGEPPLHFEIRFEIFTENLKRYRAGKPLINEVDKERGY